MTRTYRLAALFGLFALVGLAFPSVADAQRHGGGAARGGTAVVRGGGAVVHGGAAVVRGGPVYGSRVAVPRTHPPYAYYGHGYYGHGYYYRPYYYSPFYYSGFYPYYSPWSFSLSFGYGGFYGGYYPYPYYYPYYYPSPYAYPPYPYPNSYPPPSPSQAPSQPQYPSPMSNNGYNNMVSTPSTNGYQPAERSTTHRGDDQGEFGTLSIRVMPSDATILIDHQAWDRPRGEDRFSIELVEGSHQVEVRKAGFTSYVRTIEVPRGRSTVLNVALTPGGTGAMQVARTVPLR
jgi:hypothetical protein